MVAKSPRRGLNPNRKPPEEWVRRPRKLTPEQVAADPRKCGHYGHRSKQDQLPCGAMVIPGTEHCRWHAGKPAEVAKAEGAVVMELRRWGLGDSTIDPGETLLRLVSQSATRAQLYAKLLEEAYDAAERLAAARGNGNTPPLPEHIAESESAIHDLDRIFNQGGVAALVGNTYAADKQAGIFATGEAIRGLAKLESEERDRCAAMATKAIPAGLAERQVRLAEQQGTLLASVIRAVLGDLNLTPEQAQRAPEIAARHLRAVATA